MAEESVSVRYHALRNCRPGRAQAAFVALLYVFLNTFGSLTHSHVTSTPNANTPPVQAVRHNLRTAQITADTSPAPFHCQFCEWQATNIAAPLPPQEITKPHLIAFAVASRTQHPAAIGLPRPSSRAPPHLA